MKSELILLYCIYVWTSSLSLSIKPRGSHLIVIMHKQNPNNKTLKSPIWTKKVTHSENANPVREAPSSPPLNSTMASFGPKSAGHRGRWWMVFSPGPSFHVLPDGREADGKCGRWRWWTQNLDMFIYFCLTLLMFFSLFLRNVDFFQWIFAFFFWPVCIVPQNRG